MLLPHNGQVRAYNLGEQTTPHMELWTTTPTAGNGPVPAGTAKLRSSTAVGGQYAAWMDGDEGRTGPRTTTVWDLDAQEVKGRIARGEHAVFFLNDHLFVGGTPAQYAPVHDLHTEAAWRSLAYPADVNAHKPIDYFGVSDNTLWAVDDVHYPLFALAYDLTAERFGEDPEVKNLGSGQTVVDFACNDRFRAFVIGSYSGYTHQFTQHAWLEVVASGDRAAVPTGLPIASHAPVGDALCGIGLVGDDCVVAFGTVGMGVADLSSLSASEGFMDRLLKRSRPGLEWEWIEAGGVVIDVVTVENPPRVFAIVEVDGQLTWRRFDLEHREWCEQPLATPRRDVPPQPVQSYPYEAKLLQHVFEPRVDLRLVRESSIKLQATWVSERPEALVTLHPVDRGVRAVLSVEGKEHSIHLAQEDWVEWVSWILRELEAERQPRGRFPFHPTKYHTDAREVIVRVELNLGISRVVASMLGLDQHDGPGRVAHAVFAPWRGQGVTIDPNLDLDPQR